MSSTGHIFPKLLTQSVVNVVFQVLDSRLTPSFGAVIRELAQVRLDRCGMDVIHTLTLHIQKPVVWELSRIISIQMKTSQGLIAMVDLPNNVAQTDSEVMEFPDNLLKSDYVEAHNYVTSPMSTAYAC